MDQEDNLEENTRETACLTGCVLVWLFSSTRMLNAVVMVVDIKVFFILSTCLKTFKSCGLVVNDRVDGKGNHEDETMEFRDIMITSISELAGRLS